jgi:epoxyqueuosine reductase
MTAHPSTSPGAAIRARALELGFEAVGIATVPPEGAPARFEAWLAAGMHGDMAWLATDRHRERRADPLRVLPDLGSAVCVALCHEPVRDATRDERIGRIARYAAGDDYHAVMRDRLSALQAFIVERLPGGRAIWYSDTGAILERGWAQQAGIGWIGKHSGLLSPRIGSWFLLGEVLVDRPLEPDPAFTADRCGTCARCIDACPTHAIVAERQVDARLCISYLTIELRGTIPRELRPLIGDWIFGCDICQEVCPWNRFAPPAREARLHARTLDGWTLERFLDLDDAGFRALFEGSPIRRARRAGFLRNVCVALGNRRDAAVLPRLSRTLSEDPDALVREHAAWAIGEIAARAAGAARVTIEGTLERAAGLDASPNVVAEARVTLAALRASRDGTAR